MNENNLPQKYKNSFLSKFLIRIKSFFHKDINKEHVINNREYKEDRIDNKDLVFLEGLKVDVNLKNNEYEKKEFMKRLKEHPDILEKLSIGRLELILQYYLDENEKKRKLLKKLTE